ncbi:MAG: sugar ABC transporter permease [Spirochaetales bacterium]|nr:MAG: sugar ABC transporter permease [Spirochaetales bacterium]
MKNILQKENISLLILIGLLLILMAILSPGRFFSAGNMRSMASQLPELGFLSLGMMIVMITGGINLSIIATANTTGIIAALYMQSHGGPEASSAVILSAILLGLSASLLIGIINGLLIAHVEVSPILATLGMMTLLKGIMAVITKGYVISSFPEPFQFIGSGRILGIPFPLLILILIFLAVSLLLNKSPFGMELYLLGTNPTAARYSGIKTKQVLTKVYILSALLAGIAGIVMVSRFNSAKFNYGESYLLVTVLAAVLGGTDAYGGFGKTGGLFMALVLLQIVSSGLNLLQINAFLTRAIWGIILITVMIANHIRNRKPL